MKKRKEFLTLAFLLISSRAYDMTTTWLYTPDLKYETNVMVRGFHMNMLTTVIFEAIVTSGIIYCLYFYCSKKVVITGNWLKLLFAPGKDAALYSIGYILPRALSVIGFVVGASTTLLLVSPAYGRIYGHIGAGMLYVFCVVTVVFFSVLFYRREVKISV